MNYQNLEVVMSISTRLGDYLSAHDMPFQTISHCHSNSSIGTAMAAQVPLNQVAKAVMLVDHEGRKMMAVLPATHKISLSALNDELRASYHLAKEQMVYQLFEDCDHGAVPPVGDAYNMMLVCDQLLDTLDHVYMEAGDHETLIKVDKATFKALMANGKHMRFSREIFH